MSVHLNVKLLKFVPREKLLENDFVLEIDDRLVVFLYDEIIATIN